MPGLGTKILLDAWRKQEKRKEFLELNENENATYQLKKIIWENQVYGNEKKFLPDFRSDPSSLLMVLPRFHHSCNSGHSQRRVPSLWVYLESSHL